MNQNKNDLKGRIKGEAITKSFTDPEGRRVGVLEGCSFEFEPGMLNVVMGTSGCGKSTLAYLLAGYMPADSGVMTIDGRPITDPGPDRIMVFQETALWPWMTVTDNVIFGPSVRGSLTKSEARTQAAELLERFGLGEFGDKFPGQLSGGMKRRAEIAQALINSPDVMILDEPFRGLDVMTRELLQEYYLELFEDTHLTTVFITSELEEALFLADKIFMMSEPPSRISQVLGVDLPRPRTFDLLATDRYSELKKEAMTHLYAESDEDLAVVAPYVAQSQRGKTK